ncbi:glycosyltransferase [Lachnospira multipara]|uniref:Rhamnosyltransferase n=1 Tax=Lachnospira multipara TaxID=28051 RepID=A0A1H5V2C4_9FIRM|nr:glycosyltransferase [Lachnospira multipara]SEF80567.1 rhamnosyltransferase [Lachnospira multipara]
MVNILLSTYNGEKYIFELLNSLLKQKDIDFIITIRDDASTDRTVEIIESFKDERIRLIKSDINMGACKSFLRLLEIAEDADYYAYCDQDDIWYQDKLKYSVKALKKYDKEPTLFISGCDVFSNRKNYNFKRNLDFGNKLKIETTLSYRCPSACLMVFNKALKDKIKTKNLDVRMHDFWTLLVAFAVEARIITSDESLIKYRIHDANTVGLEKNYLKKIDRLIKSATRNKNERQRQAICLYENYSDILSKDNKRKIEKILNYKDSFKNRLNLMFDKNYSDGVYIKLVFALSVLFGVF